jgi:hypothetical protein
MSLHNRMRDWLGRLLTDVRTVYVACAITLALGLFFTFVWAPHPWDWRGIDQYHNLALALARGEPFGTTDVPWGYAYYVAAFYALFGPHAWIPVTAQVLINALAPLLIYALARPLTTPSIAILTALLTGLFSFNTIYASTQASDAVCTVLFIAMMLCFSRARASGAWSLFAIAGLLAGLVPQFRPNLILFPPLLAAAYVALDKGGRRLPNATVYLLLFALALVPWVVRNYNLTGRFMPTSTHGGVQLWYGTLQTGPYLESRAYNPRSIFEAPTFPYTSITDQPIIVTAVLREAAPETATTVELKYRTDRDSTVRSVMPSERTGRTLTFHIPPQPAPTAIYYHFTAEWPPSGSAEGARQVIPADAARDPLIFFVDTRHLGDLDRYGEFLDVFDIARMVQHVRWGTALPPASRLDLNDDGVVDVADVARAVASLVGKTARDASRFSEIADVDGLAVLRFPDGSSLTVPREAIERVTDLTAQGPTAGALIYTRRTFQSIDLELSTLPGSRPPACCVIGDVEVNEVFFRKEPHLMGRYLALAFDNIGRDPFAFAAASAYRLFRLFVIKGSDDEWTAHQFRWSSVVYAVGTVLSLANLVAFGVGVWIAWRRRFAVLPLALAVAYVPLTICFVLTNMRYTITVQPFMFVFVAVALVTALGLERRPVTAIS